MVDCTDARIYRDGQYISNNNLLPGDVTNPVVGVDTTSQRVCGPGCEPNPFRKVKRRMRTFALLLVVVAAFLSMIPLTQPACAVLTIWLLCFPDANTESLVFPFHHVAIAGNDRIPHIYGVNADRPMTIRATGRRSILLARRLASTSVFTTPAIRSLPGSQRIRRLRGNEPSTGGAP